MKPETIKQNTPDGKLNSECFLLPILAAFLPTTIEGSAALLGLLVSGIGALSATCFLLFRPSPKVKGAVWNYFFGFALALVVFVAVANFINAGQTSP